MRYTWLKRLLITFFAVLMLAILLFFSITSAEKIQPHSISSDDVRLSHQVLTETVDTLRNNTGRIALQFDQQQLDALMNVASYALPQARFSSVISPYGVAISVQAPLFFHSRSIRAGCLLLNEGTRFAIVQCQLGRLPVPAFVANWILQQAVKKAVTAPADEQLLRLFASGRLTDERLVFIDDNASPIALNLQNTLYSPVALLQDTPVLAPDIVFYLNELKQLQRQYPGERRLAFFALNLLNTAHQRRASGSHSSQYHDATWALIVAFGNRKFIHFANNTVSASQVGRRFVPAILSNRRDLAQHFLYSAAFKLLSSAQLSEQIGNLKELMDAAEGGSGFSFVDLAADRAGIQFALQLDQLQHAKLPLYNSISFEQAIIPPLHDLPEGLSEQQLAQLYGGYEGEGFKQLEQEIMARIAALQLYRNTVIAGPEAQ